MIEIDTLMGINRSITGSGVRLSLQYLKTITDFEVKEIPSGTKVFDWEVPDEWTVWGATIKDEHGMTVVDYENDYLHLVGYSRPFKGVLTLDELKKHLHTLPDRPDVIPYITSYYADNWGFCLSHNQLKELTEGNYTVEVNTKLEPGSLTYGETVLGNGGGEYLISTYCCHPNMINDNTAGMVLWAKLLEYVKTLDLKNTYRFVIAPETIGMISYLSRNDQWISDIDGAFVITHVVGKGEIQFKKSFLGRSSLDLVAGQVIKTETPFDIRGSDERQLSSYPFRIPTIVISRGGLYQDGYHSSEDRTYRDSDFDETLDAYKQVIDLLEAYDTYYKRTQPCEPMLSRHGLYPTFGGDNQTIDNTLVWTAFYSDGTRTPVSIAEKIGKPVAEIIKASRILKEKGLIV